MELIRIKDLRYSYVRRDEEGEKEEALSALSGVNLQVEKGSFLAILGHNGSGKSTLARHLNALLLPESGTVWIDGKDTAREENLFSIRRKAGMVFQNPDNQIVANTVEEDTAFGPENLGLPSAEIRKRTEACLERVGMTAYRYSSPNQLSGGQKQRVSIAGVLAMKPDCLILDEPTAMLDPQGREQVLGTVRELNAVEGITVILITQNMEEVVNADRVLVMERGQIALDGTPEELFAQPERLQRYHLELPPVTQLGYLLQREGLPVPGPILTQEAFLRAFTQFVGEPLRRDCLPVGDRGGWDAGEKGEKREAVLELRELVYRYQAGASCERNAVDGVSLTVRKGEFLAFVGHTGSGKSTLAQLLNGLRKPSGGSIWFHGEDIHRKGYDLRRLRTRVGLVFQYPEHQLFEADLFSDVCFGPRNMGLPEEEVRQRAEKALRQVGIQEERFPDSPFSLSGGEKRRAALAGILAMEPEVLVLDEPTAGLDPLGRKELLTLLHTLHTGGMTVLLITHSMEEAAGAERVVVMNQGRDVLDGSPREVFSHGEELARMGLALPVSVQILRKLKQEGYPCRADVLTMEEAAKELAELAAGNVSAQMQGE